MILIRLIKLFFLIILISYSIVWLAENPGNIEIVWKDYLLQTDFIGFAFFLVFLVFILIFSYFFIQKITSFPERIRASRNIKFQRLGNKALNDIASNIFLNEFDEIEKNSRKLRKYFDNQIFSTFMLFYSSMVKNDTIQAKKYLNLLENIPEAGYIFKRGLVLIHLKERKIDAAKELLSDVINDFPNDDWFGERLAIIFSKEEKWEQALNAVENTNLKKNKRLLNMVANLKILSGKKPTEVVKFSSESIFVVAEAIKSYLDNGELKKASNLIEKNWSNFDCLFIIEVFMRHNLNNEKDSLQRFKLISRILKKVKFQSDETKLALAFSAFEANMWGESQSFLDMIKKSSWDNRMVDLYKKISEKSIKISLPSLPDEIIERPLWRCEECKRKYEAWKFICDECGEVNKIIWPKSSFQSQNKNKITNILQNSFSHFPKMN